MEKPFFVDLVVITAQKFIFCSMLLAPDVGLEEKLAHFYFNQLVAGMVATSFAQPCHVGVILNLVIGL